MPIGKFKPFKFLFSSPNTIDRDDVTANFVDDNHTPTTSQTTHTSVCSTSTSGNGKDQKKKSLNFSSNSTFDPKALEAEEEDETLEDYLDTEDITSRCKELADYHLIQFFAKDTVIKRLLKYIAADFTEEEQNHFAEQRIRSLEKQKKKPKPSVKKSKGTKQPELDSPTEETKIDKTEILDRIHFKYPHFSVEVLISSIGKGYVLAKIFDSKTDKIPFAYPPKRNHFSSENLQQTGIVPTMTHLDYMFLLMTQDTKPNIVTVSPPCAKNFVKLFKEIANTAKFTKKLMSYVYTENGKVLKALAHQINATEEMCEIILMCLLFRSDDDDSDDEETKISEDPLTKIKEEVLNLFITLLQNPSYCESAGAVISTIAMLQRPSPLVNLLLTKERTKRIVGQTIANAADIDIFSEGLDFLGTVILHGNESDVAAIEIIFNHLSDFVHLLHHPPLHMDPIETTVGVVEKPFGYYRLKIIEFFVILFRNLKELEAKFANHVDLRGLLLQSNVLHACTQLFFDYENNNILHNLVTHIISCILDLQISDFLIQLLSKECNFLPRMIEAFQRNQIKAHSSRQTLSHMGHITIIENFLNNLENEAVKVQLQSYEGWEALSEQMKEKHFIECIYRHGGNISIPDGYLFRVFGIKEGNEENATSVSSPNALQDVPLSEEESSANIISPVQLEEGEDEETDDEDDEEEEIEKIASPMSDDSTLLLTPIDPPPQTS